jgi:MraZ protein
VPEVKPSDPPPPPPAAPPEVKPNPAVPEVKPPVMPEPRPIAPAQPMIPAVPEVKPLPPAAPAAPGEPGEPPLAPQPGPVQIYQVRHTGETLFDIARRTLGSTERWGDLHKLNPHLAPEKGLAAGAIVRLPADACVPQEELEAVRPLPPLHPDSGTPRPKVVLPLTGTFPCNLDEKMSIALPRAIRDQLGNGDTLLVSPGPDHCLWLTNQAHLERLAKRLESAPVREAELRVFKRLYFAQTEKITLSADGRLAIPERLAQFAGLHQEVVLVGIDDHFELWDVARWRLYTQQKSAAARAAMSED